MTVRNCDAEPRTAPVFHPGLPATAPRTTVCPERVVRDPEVQHYLILYQRVKLWGTLPRAGGLYDQLPADLAALDTLAEALSVPWPAPGSPQAGPDASKTGPRGGDSGDPAGPAVGPVGNHGGQAPRRTTRPSRPPPRRR